MLQDNRRITLVLRGLATNDRQWKSDAGAPNRLIFVGAYNVLQYAVRNALTEFHRDVERVVLDRSVTATQYLELLASLPHEFHGDVLLINRDHSGFLSAGSRGGDRVLYALTATDIAFYLETNGLTGQAMAA